MTAVLDKVICKLIKKYTVAFGDVVELMTECIFMYSLIVLIICSWPIIAAIYNPQYFEMIVLAMPVMIVFVFIPFFLIPYLVKCILKIVGLYDDIMKMKISECPKNSEKIEAEKSVASIIDDKIMPFFLILLVILQLIHLAEIIYFHLPTEGLGVP
jgi:hypothetical protein